LVLGFICGPKVAGSYVLGCHETLTSEALRTVRLELAEAAPLPVTRNEMAFIDDVEFRPGADMKDLGGISLLLGVRDNDLKGHGALELTELANVHGNPLNQDEHCLRNEAQDEPNGSQQAVADCQKFIRRRIEQALDGLDAQGKPDLNKRVRLPVQLALRDRVELDLPVYYVRMGQAIHAIQDSFSHAFRTAESTEITVVLNWIDFTRRTLDEKRDGPKHAAKLDNCNRSEELFQVRRSLASRATADLLRATLNSSKNREQKLAEVDATIAAYLTFAPGCGAANGWCDSPELNFKDDTSLGCNSSNTRNVNHLWLWSAFLGLCFLMRRTWRRRMQGAVLLFVMATLSSTISFAQEEGEPKGSSVMAYGLYLGASASVYEPALAAQLGARLRLSESWTLGLDGEWNPWISINAATPVRAGVANVFASAIWRIPLAYENFNLRSTFKAGISIMLIDLYAAPRGSVGPFLGLSPLGIEWKISRFFALVMDPLNIAVPIPQLVGVPLVHPQYRFSLGIESLFD
jgi:hypothetical protein